MQTMHNNQVYFAERFAAVSREMTLVVSSMAHFGIWKNSESSITVVGLIREYLLRVIHYSCLDDSRQVNMVR